MAEHTLLSAASQRKEPRPQPAARYSSRRASLPAHLHHQFSADFAETRERSRDRATLHTRPQSLVHPAPIRFPPANNASDRDDASTSTSATLTVSDAPHPPSIDSPRRCYSSPRPKLVERPCSTIYTTFPLRPPRTPGDGPSDDETNGTGDWRRWLSWVPAATASSSQNDLERASLSKAATRDSYPEARNVEIGVNSSQGLPKLSRECLIAEIKCYGKVSTAHYHRVSVTY